MPDAMIIACPHCHSKNRLPAGRRADAGKCGHCKQSLYTGKPIALDESNFDAHASGDIPLVVDFWASWCGPCQQFAPTFEQAAGQLGPEVQLVKVNTETAQTLAQRFAIRSIPTLAIIRNGKEITRLSGALPGQQFIQWVRQHIG